MSLYNTLMEMIITESLFKKETAYPKKINDTIADFMKKQPKDQFKNPIDAYNKLYTDININDIEKSYQKYINVIKPLFKVIWFNELELSEDLYRGYIYGIHDKYLYKIDCGFLTENSPYFKWAKEYDLESFKIPKDVIEFTLKIAPRNKINNYNRFAETSLEIGKSSISGISQDTANKIINYTEKHYKDKYYMKYNSVGLIFTEKG